MLKRIFKNILGKPKKQSNLLFPDGDDFSLLRLLNPPSYFHWCCCKCQTLLSGVSEIPKVVDVSTRVGKIMGNVSTM